MRFFVIFLLLLSSCQKKSPPVQPKQIIRTCLGTDVNSIDPRKGADMASQGVGRMLFAGLAYLDQNLNPQLDLASSYQISDDYKTYTFYLKDAVWSDGSPISARDFEETWKSALTPAYNSSNTNLFYFIKNCKKAILGAASIDQIGVHASDDKTLIIELEAPHRQFLNVLTNLIFAPVHQSIRYTPIDFSHLISSGPFYLKEYAFQNQIVLEKNRLYWNADQIKIDEIDYNVIKDHNTALLMFEKGEIDWMGDPLIKIPADAMPSLKSKGLLRSLESAGTYWLLLNTTKFPLNNANIRKALACAIDREKILQNIMHFDHPSPPLGVIPKILKREKWHPWFQDNDVKAAKEYFAKGLEELGITVEEFPPITLNTTVNPLWSKITQATQQMWAENLGIKAKIDATDWPIFVRKFYNLEHQVAHLGWIMQYNDPVSILEFFKLKNSQPNYTGWENAEYVRHTDACNITTGDEKWEHVEAAEKIFFDEMPSIPLMDAVAFQICQPHLKGVSINYLFQLDFRWAYIDKSEENK